jgi:hypothetical protein
MSDEELLQKALASLDALIEATKAKRAAVGSRDCINDCHHKYDSCMANARSDAEKLACKANYNSCITNC